MSELDLNTIEVSSTVDARGSACLWKPKKESEK